MSTVATVRAVLLLQAGDATAGEIAEALRLSPEGVRDMLKRLVDAGYVEFKRWQQSSERAPGRRGPDSAVYGWRAAA